MRVCRALPTTTIRPTKCDANLTDKDRFYGVFIRGKWATDYTGNLTATGTALPLPYTTSPGIVNEITTIGQLHHTHVFTPTLISNFSMGATRLWIPIFSTTADGNYSQKAGLAGLPANGFSGTAFPAINFNCINAGREVYRIYDVPQNIGYLNHHTGHTPTPGAVAAAFAWLDHLLSP